MKHIITILVVAAAVAVSPAGASHDTRTSKHTYTGGSRFPSSSVGGPCLPNYVAGAPADGNHICAITFKGDEVSISVTLQDAAGWVVGGSIDFWGSSFISSARFCGSSGDVPIPAGATKAQFGINGPGAGYEADTNLPPCVSLEPFSPGFATTGTATVTFRLKDE